MTRETFKTQYANKQFRATIDANIKYTYQLGGGIRSNARTVKAGDIITVSGYCTDIDTVTIATKELLNRVDLGSFNAIFNPIN